MPFSHHIQQKMDFTKTLNISDLPQFRVDVFDSWTSHIFMIAHIQFNYILIKILTLTEDWPYAFFLLVRDFWASLLLHDTGKWLKVGEMVDQGGAGFRLPSLRIVVVLSFDCTFLLSVCLFPEPNLLLWGRINHVIHPQSQHLAFLSHSCPLLHHLAWEIAPAT